ncbi:MAG TPA: lipid-A-disaccharide synthase [Verrucomicrobiales bacterium]|nr:lipid-A-disaccharide synthase [Verrucomicrobiales bacterium]
MKGAAESEGRPLRLLMVAGEASGDIHAAALARSILAQRPDAAMRGLGGPLLRNAAGPGVEDWIDRAAVVGLVEVLRHYGFFRKKLFEIAAIAQADPPDGVVLVDYPGFNLRLARELRAGGYAGRLVYYISPQVWAWRRSRIPKMARWLDLMICLFPFEVELFAEAGLPAVFVGHPMADRLAGVPRLKRRSDLVGWFPGSREREVARLFPVMLEAGRRLARRHPELQFVAAAASPLLGVEMERMAADPGLPPCRVVVGEALRLMQECAVGAVASGTATLEAAYLQLPYCLVYRVAWPTYAVGKTLIRVPYLGMVNLLAGREVVRELLQSEATPEAVEKELTRLLEDSGRRAELQKELGVATEQLGERGSYDRAATAILEALEGGRASSSA